MTIEQAATIPEVPFETTTSTPVAEDSYETVVDTASAEQTGTVIQQGLGVEAFAQEVMTNNPDLTVDTLTASLSNPASDAFPVVGYGTPSLPENDIMVASAALEGNPQQLIRYRVFENDVRVSEIYRDWSFDTFVTLEDAINFVRRWGHPGLSDEELEQIEVLVDVPLDCKLGDAPRTMLIKIVDIALEPIPQRFQGHQGIPQNQPVPEHFDTQAFGDESVTVSVTPDGRCVAVIRQNPNTGEAKMVWQAQPLPKVPMSWVTMVERATTSKKSIVPIQMRRDDILQLNALLPHIVSVDQYIKWTSSLRRAQQVLTSSNPRDEDTQNLEELIAYLNKLNRQR